MSEFRNRKYFRDIAIYECLLDAYRRKYDKICFLTPDIKIIDEHIVENINDYNIFCLNPHDVNKDCVILNSFIISYIIENVKITSFTTACWKENFYKRLSDNFKVFYPEKNYVKHKVDFVLTYVNDNDENWKKTYKETFGNLDYNSLRFKDYGTLEELVLGIRKNAKFIDDIYIIVQNKSEVNISCKDIKIIEHKDIIPNKLLPTFNSCTIEMFLGNIPGLSEYFIYGNDDMFFVNEVEESEFFEDGKLCVSLMNLDKSNLMYHKVVQNSFKLFFQEFDYTYFKDIKLDKNYKNLKHVPHPMRKSTCLHIYDLYDIQSSCSILRNDKNLNQYIYIFYDYFIGNVKETALKNRYFGLSNLKNISFNEQIICINDDIKEKNDKCKEFKRILQDKIYKIKVSLTSYPKRINCVNEVILSLLNQSLHYDLYDIILVLSKTEFNELSSLPIDLQNTINFNNIEIIWYDYNILSHKKIIPVLEKYKDCTILICDDDIARPNNWIETFYNDHFKFQNDILVSSTKTYLDKNLNIQYYTSCGLPTKAGLIYSCENTLLSTQRPMNGFGGVLYPKNTFSDRRFFDKELFMNISPTSDEMWQWCFNIMENKTFRTIIKFFNYSDHFIENSQKLDTCLFKINDLKYQSILNLLCDTFPDFKENLLKRINKKSCICTICNDDFVEGCMTMIYSFLQHNKWFNDEIVILYSDKYSILSNKSKNKIKQLYNKIVFKKINDYTYDNLTDFDSIPKKFIPPLIKLEIFNMTEYNKILWLDSDTLILNDIFEFYQDESDLVVFTHENFIVESPYNYKYHNKQYHINNGVILLNNEIISNKSFYILSKILYEYNRKCNFYRGCPDQDIMEEFMIRNVDKFIINIFPNYFNSIKRKYKFANKIDKRDKILHFVMNKPWINNESEYSFINNLWFNYNSNMKLYINDSLSNK